MKKPAYLLVLAAGLVLAGCGSTGESASSSEETISSSDESSSVAETTSSESSESDIHSSDTSSSEPEVTPEELTTAEGLKTVFDGLIEKTVVAWDSDITTQTTYSTTKKTVHREIASQEAMATTYNKDTQATSTSYYGILGDVYYKADVPSQAQRFKIVEDTSSLSSTQYTTLEAAESKVEYQLGQNGLKTIFNNWDTNAGDPWYGGNKKAATAIEVVDVTKTDGVYEVTVTAYYEAEAESYYQCYTYTGLFGIRTNGTDGEGNTVFELDSVIATLKYCEPASWDYEKHDVLAGETSYTNIFMADGFVYGTVPTTDPENPIFETLGDYFVTGVDGTATLEGQSGYGNDGEPVFQIGDTPSLAWGTSFLPETALNSRYIVLTGCSDETALNAPADSWSGYTFAKSGTFDLYFGDAVEPRLIVVEDVKVQERAAEIPLFLAMNPFGATTANGCTVTSTTDWNTLETSTTVTLPLGTDTIYVRINPVTGSEDEVFNLDAISYQVSDPAVLEATLGTSSDMTIDYDFSCWLLPIDVNVKAAGTSTLTLTTTGEGSFGNGTSSTATITITATDGTAGFDWNSLEATWNNGLGGYSFPFDLIVEPTFDYTKATITNGYSSNWSPVSTLKIYTEEANLDAYIDQILGITFDFDGVTYYCEERTSANEGETVIALLSELYDMGTATVSYDSEGGCIAVAWALAE